jgi:hypothetical protein
VGGGHARAVVAATKEGRSPKLLMATRHATDQCAEHCGGCHGEIGAHGDE